MEELLTYSSDNKWKVSLEKLDDSNLEDARKLRNYYSHLFFTQSFISQENHKRWFNSLNEDMWFFLIKREGSYIGTISIKFVEDNLIEIGNFLLTKKNRKEGIGSFLLEVIKHIFERDIVIFIKDKKSVRKFYERNGFVNTSTSPIKDRLIYYYKNKNDN